MKLTAIILTYNEAANISACIESLRFADTILVFDSFSLDDTVALARWNGAQVIQHPFVNYADQRNAAMDTVTDGDWVLFIDADERVSEALADEILSVIDKPGYAGWRIPRHNFIFGKLTRWAGWYPDYQLRLLKLGAARYDPERQVHEVVLLRGLEGKLSNPLTHYNYKDAAHFARKQQVYARYEARILFEQGIKPKFRNFILQPLRQFWWRFVTLDGYKDGMHGLRLSALMGWYELKKYLLLREMWQAKM